MKQPKVAIIDYQLGNLFSVKQACEFLGYEAEVTSDKNVLLKADYAILPGVGAFGDAMQNLKGAGMVEAIKEFIGSGRPFMGICLGLQLLLDGSEEFGSYEGLGIIPGTVKRFTSPAPNGEIVKVPQIEWNQIFRETENGWNETPLQDCKDGDYMYFVHSYYTIPAERSVVLSETEYGGLRYCSSVQKENVFACQFHPEKSGKHGLNIYKNWFKTINVTI